MGTSRHFGLYCYNQQAGLEVFLERFAQREGDWYCIILDDGSTDGSAAIVKRFVDRDRRFRYVFQQHQGVAVARNTLTEVFGFAEWELIDAAQRST